MKYIRLLLLLFVVSLYSCEEKDIEVFKGKSQLYFEKFYMDAVYPGNEEKDSTVISYFFYSSTTEDIDAKLIVNFSGTPLENDANYKFKVIEEETTAKSDEYTIPESYTFKANNFGEDCTQIRDTAKITFHKSDRLESLEDGVKLVIELIPNNIFDLGQYERRRAVIICTTKASKPDWWDSEVTSKLLGKYSLKKFKLFLDNIDKTSKMSKELIKKYPDEAVKLAIEFKEWLSKQDPAITEEDGSLMTVTI